MRRGGGGQGARAILQRAIAAEGTWHRASRVGRAPSIARGIEVSGSGSSTADLVHKGGVKLKGMWLGWRERRARIIRADGEGLWGGLSLNRTVVSVGWHRYLIMRPMREFAGCTIREKKESN